MTLAYKIRLIPQIDSYEDGIHGAGDSDRDEVVFRGGHGVQ